MKKNIFILFCLALVYGCNPNRQSNSIIPKEFVFAVIPGDDYTTDMSHAGDFCKFLEKKLNMKVTLYKATDYTSVIEAMKSNKVQVARFGPFSYVLANRKAGAESLVCVGEGPGVFHSYESLILVNAKSKIKTIDDLKKNAAGLTLSFVDPASTSGHLMPRAFLTSIGLDPESKFKQVVFSTTHAASLLTLITGKVDVAAANTISLERLITNGAVKRSDFTILWMSKPIPPDPICIEKNLNPAFKEMVRNAFLSLPKEAPAIWKSFVDYEYKGDPKAETYLYINAPDSIYNPVRKVFDNINYEKLISGK